MDSNTNENKILRRSGRTPKPQMKKEINSQDIVKDSSKNRKLPAKGGENAKTIKRTVAKKTSETVMASNLAAKNALSEDVSSIGGQPINSSGENVTNKQILQKKPRKLGLFIIDCEEIVGQKKINMDAFKTYLQQHIKVEGKKEDKRIKIDQQNMLILINAKIFVEQKYIKYMIKTYLKKTKLHNFIKIENGKKLYKLKYFMK